LEEKDKIRTLKKIVGVINDGDKKLSFKQI
jgi:hypothetical protein